jgi:hypothetical protein
VNDSNDITRRLLAMSSQDRQPGLIGPGASVQARQLGRERGPRRRVRAAGERSMADDPYSTLPSGRLPGRRRGRYVIWSALTLVVVGVGTAFGVGGSSGSTGPQITPQLEVYDAQHAITSGDVPFEDPMDVPARVPVVAATP